MTDVILREITDGIVTLTLNKPELRNPISDDDILNTLLSELTAADAELSTRVVIVTGAGSAFSSGGNLRKMGETGGLHV